MTITIYHNPRCSKSRQTLELLQQRGIAPHTVEYLTTPPSTAEIERILELLGMEPRELMRREEAEYTEHRLDDPTLSRAQLIQAMHDLPRLIQRPIVVADGKAAIGRPPERVLEIL